MNKLTLIVVVQKKETPLATYPLKQCNRNAEGDILEEGLRTEGSPTHHPKPELQHQNGRQGLQVSH